MDLKRFIPSRVRSAYHFLIAHGGAILYGNPSRRLRVIGVTGTKGKTSTTEMIASILEAAGEKTALINSIRIKVADTAKRNPTGRSMPGRAQLQKFMRDALSTGCTYAVIEMTSEGARQHRHRGIQMDALVFLNLAPEHIESHGSYAAYADAKYELARALRVSQKRPRIIVANAHDEQSARYLSLPVEVRVGFSLADHSPWHASPAGGSFTYEGVRIDVPQPGEFSLENALAAAETARACGVSTEKIRDGLASLKRIPGRADAIDEGQDFTVIVDYAHTPDSLAALLRAYPGRKICILGSAGGGRDTWKRPVMGKTAEQFSDIVILTTDDPYDDDPQTIIDEMAAGMSRKPEIVLDRRLAIRKAIEHAQSGDTVLITGKGIDPMYGKGGEKIPWDDAAVAREELRAHLGTV